MTKILRYNWRFYAQALAGVGAAVLIATFIRGPWRALILAATLPVIWWLGSSLLVSYYVYDRSPLYGLRWLDGCLSRSPLRWVNIHAGLDETSRRLSAMFPTGKGTVLDMYDPDEMTEPSIAEARLTALDSVPATRADWRALPLPDHVFDAAFLIFAAHELRRPEARAQLFHEVSRALRPGGELVLVEHLRDWPNFLAFGPGFLHFHSERAWRRAAADAGLDVQHRASVTPFVQVFLLRPAL